MNQDEEHLKLLTIFHYVVAGMTALMALLPIFHLIFGLVMIFAPQIFNDSHGQGAPPAFFGWFFVIFALAFITLGWLFAFLIFLNGRFLHKRRHYTFCFVVAAVECMLLPFGTVLGVLTLIVLSRESVKRLFGVRLPVPPPSSPG